MPPMSFLSELMSSNGTTPAATGTIARAGLSATTTTATSNNSINSILNSDFASSHAVTTSDNDPTEPEKENAKLVSIRELVARNASRDRPALVVMDPSTENKRTAKANSRQQLLDMLIKKAGNGEGAHASSSGSITASPSSSASSSLSTTPTTTSPRNNQNHHKTAAASSASASSNRTALNDLLLKRQPSQPKATMTTNISPKAARAKKRAENPALQAMFAQRSGGSSVPTSAVSTPTTSSTRKAKNPAIADLLAKRVAVAAPPPASRADGDNNTPEKNDVTKNALAEMLTKRNGSSNRTSNNHALADMLAKRHQQQPEQAASTTSTSDKADPKAHALAEMLARRNGSVAPAPSRDAVADMLAKRTPAPPAQSQGDARSSALAEMLAKRSNNNSNNTGSVATPPPVANPLAKMLAKRQQAAAMENAASTTSDNSAPAAETTEATAIVDEHANTPLKEHPKYASYFKMLKIGQPPEVVRHRMRREGVDVAILDCDPSKPLPKEPLTAQTSGDDDNSQDPEFVEALKLYNTKFPKYQQMLKMGLPRGAVEHKMRMEGVEPAWIDGPPQPKKKPTATASAGPTDAEIAAHREKYAQYFQMLKMGLPRGAVEHKMRMAGVDPQELDGPIVSKAATPPSTAAAASSRARGLPPTASIKKANSIRKKLHWEVKRQESRDSQRESLWNVTLAEDSTLSQVRLSQESKAMLEKFFVKDMTAKATTGNEKDPNATKGGKQKQQAKKQVMYLIDMKKSQNIAITLARIKLSFVELKREILALNPTVLSTAQLQSLMDMWPDQTEQVAIDNFHGDESTIGAAEKFLVEVRNIPRFKEKLGCLVFKQEFPTRIHEIRESINLVIRGVNQVCCSTALQQLFIYILQTGNLLNFGTDDTSEVNVGGFSLNSLIKLSQTKAFTGGMTFLQYIVQCIERDLPSLGKFPQQINLIQKCAKVSISSLQSEKRALEEGLKSLTHEAKAVVAADADAQLGASILKNFATEVELELQALQDLLDQMMDCKGHFLEYFEEEETSEELDVLLSHIASFTLDFQREHGKYVEQKEKLRLQEQQKQDQEAKKEQKKLQHAAKSARQLHAHAHDGGGGHSNNQHPVVHSRSHSHGHGLVHGHNHSHGHGHGHGHAHAVVTLKPTPSGQSDACDSTSNQQPAATTGTNNNTTYFPQFVSHHLKKTSSFKGASDGPKTA